MVNLLGSFVCGGFFGEIFWGIGLVGFFGNISEVKFPGKFVGMCWGMFEGDIPLCNLFRGDFLVGICWGNPN